MLKKHYINFGTAKTATTWLYRQLLKNQDIENSAAGREKEPSLDIAAKQDSYIDYFDDAEFGVNFNPSLWMLDSYQLDWIGAYQTHCSIIFRNPFEMVNSYYNFWNMQGDPSILGAEEFIKQFDEYFQYAKILKRLPKNVHLILYDAIKYDPVNTVNSLCDYLDIPQIQINTQPINKTRKTKELTFSDNAVKILNYRILEFQDYTSINLSHWIKNV